jgi:hypothetical protein
MHTAVILARSTVFDLRPLRKMPVTSKLGIPTLLRLKDSPRGYSTTVHFREQKRLLS